LNGSKARKNKLPSIHFSFGISIEQLSIDSLQSKDQEKSNPDIEVENALQFARGRSQSRRVMQTPKTKAKTPGYLIR
jgi:hypothetical protein